MPIELVDALRVDAPIGSLPELMTDPGLETAVLCGHGEQIGGLVRQLADGGLVGDASLRWAKGSTWVLDTNQGRVVGARYLAPPRLKDLAGHYLGVASLGHRRRQAGRRVAGRSTASSCVDLR